MSDTGYKNAGNAVDQYKTGSSSSWSAPGNVVSSNNVYASSAMPALTYSNWLRIYDFACGIPTEATVDGIEVGIERKSAHYGVHRDDDVVLADGFTAKSSDYSKVNQFYLVSDSLITYGGPSDLWGTSWTPAEINNLNIFYSVCNDGCCGETCYVDHVKVRVWYNVTSQSGNLLLLGPNF